MDHRLTSLKFLAATGLIPVKVRPGQKDPFPEWDPRLVALADHSGTLHAIRADNTLNIGGLFFGRYVDIDVDTTNPNVSAALDYFLPRTPYVWGRKTKPRSHRVYALHSDFDRGPFTAVLKFIKGMVFDRVDDQSYSIELRGGKPEQGLFSVLPGSIHPCGEVVEWEDEFDPTVSGAYVEITRLVRAIRLAVTAAMIVPHWVEGTRNELSLALAGVMWRVRNATMAAMGLSVDEDSPPEFYVVDEDDASAILRAVMKIAGDDPNDERSRILNLKNTWAKLQADTAVKVTGGKALAAMIGEKVGPKLVRALYRLLSDSDASEQLEKLAEQYVMWYGPGVLIDLRMVENNRMNPWMNKFQAEASMGGRTVTIGDNKVPISKLLFSSSLIDRIYGLTFDPSTTDLVVKTEGGMMVNQWRGFAIDPCPQQVSASEIKMFLDYIENVIACGDALIKHWVLAWMADIIQNPSNKCGTALVLVGPEGAGKTFLGEHVLGPIIGASHYKQINSITSLTHNFNTIIDNKILIHCDEAIHNYQRADTSRLKSIVTDKTITIEPKGINAYTKPNHMRFMFTSNEEHAAMFISASPHERRYTVLKVASTYTKDRKYWDDMHVWMPQSLHKIMRYLQGYNYDRWLIMRPLETKAKKDMQKVGLDPEVAWMLSRIAAGFPLSAQYHEHWFSAFNTEHITKEDKQRNIQRRDVWPNRVSANCIEADFKTFVRGTGKTVYTGSVMTTIKRILPPDSLLMAKREAVRYVDQRGSVVTDRVRLYSWPPVKAIIERLKELYGEIIDKQIEEAVEELMDNTPPSAIPEEY